jgi:general secretion pathway protein M
MKSIKQLQSLPGLLVGLLLVLLPLIGLAGYVYLQHHAAQKRLSDLEPRYARLLGLVGQQSQIEDAVDQARQLQDLYIYPSTQDVSQVGNAAQQRIRDLFTSAGVDVQSSQVLPGKTDHRFDRIPIQVRYEGEMAKLQALLVAVGTQPGPAVLVEGMTVQILTYATNQAPARLTGQINFFVLRSAS